MVEYKIAEGHNSFTAYGLGIVITDEQTFKTDDEAEQRMLDAVEAVERVSAKSKAAD